MFVVANYGSGVLSGAVDVEFGAGWDLGLICGRVCCFEVWAFHIANFARGACTVEGPVVEG